MAAFTALRPRLVVNLFVALAVLVSWAAIAAVAIAVAQRGLAAEGGPGDLLLRQVPELAFPQWINGFVALCAGPASLWGGEAAGFALLWLMWSLMAVATMLPSAAPMIRTYCEIADTAAAKGEAAVHPLLLVAGYVSVWIAAAAAFAGLTVMLNDRMALPVAGFAAPAALAAAGLYQFSGLKQACLNKCRNPFSVLFARWSARPSRILRLGAEQGAWCLGCCWALMLVMFAVGIMNLFWMALIGLFTVEEKQSTGSLPTRLAGGILLVWAAALLLVSR